MYIGFFCLMIRRTPRSTRTDTLFSYTTLFLSLVIQVDALTPHRDDRAFNTSILQMQTVKLNILRVGNGGKVCLSVCGTVVILNGGKCPFNLSQRSEEHTSELQSLMRISYAGFCLKKKTRHQYNNAKVNQM